MEFGNGVALRMELALELVLDSLGVEVEVSQDMSWRVMENGRHLLEIECMDSSSLLTPCQKEPHCWQATVEFDFYQTSTSIHCVIQMEN